MLEEIRNNLENPDKLEELYRTNKNEFRSAFLNNDFPAINTDLLNFWKIRLSYNRTDDIITTEKKSDFIPLIITCLITGILINLHNFSDSLGRITFYMKFISIIIFVMFSIYYLWTNDKLTRKNQLYIALVSLVSGLYIFFLPFNESSHSILLAYLHLPVLIWFLFGMLFAEFDYKENAINYIKFNGDMLILIAVFLMTGIILSAVSIQMFAVMGIHFEQYLMDYIAFWAVASSPIIASYIIGNHKSITNKLAPAFAKIFTPIVLIDLVVSLIIIIYKGLEIYQNRDFLLIFNVMLIVVMAIILFSFSEVREFKRKGINELFLTAIIIVALIIDLIALSAISYRLMEFGLSPNKISVLVTNVLIFFNLVLLLGDLFKLHFRNSDISIIFRTISSYSVLYIIWLIIVVFTFPFIFGMK